jgi:hypothetical protein
MASASFSSLVHLPVIITEPGLYKTRSGEIVRVDRVSSNQDFGCSGTYPGGVVEGWHRSGRLYFGMECPNDIVEKA